VSLGADRIRTAARRVKRSDPPGIVAALVLMVAMLTSCGHQVHSADTSTPPTQSAVHNGADVDFARNMIPHHQQAVTLAAMVPAHTANPELRVIATHIAADQQSEVRTLNGLLAGWGEPTVDPDGTSSPHQDGMPMMGMVDQATLDRLHTLNDDGFDTLWATSMIGHHEGAVRMAQDEVAHGESPDGVRVAKTIVTTQQREIAVLTHLISAAQ
jgi:uncharacterized protein (DUF305 family)